MAINATFGVAKALRALAAHKIKAKAVIFSAISFPGYLCKYWSWAAVMNYIRFLARKRRPKKKKRKKPLGWVGKYAKVVCSLQVAPTGLIEQALGGQLGARWVGGIRKMGVALPYGRRG